MKFKDQLIIWAQFLYMPADKILVSCFSCVLLMQQIMLIPAFLWLPDLKWWLRLLLHLIREQKARDALQ